MLHRIPVSVISRVYARCGPAYRCILLMRSLNNKKNKKNTTPFTLDQVLVGQWLSLFNLPENNTSFPDQHAHEHTNGCKCIFYLNNVAQDVKMITGSG